MFLNFGLVWEEPKLRIGRCISMYLAQILKNYLGAAGNPAE